MSNSPEITAAKQRLPLPDLLARYGHACPSHGGSMKSPFRPDEKNPSFSVCSFSDGWGWKDHGAGEDLKGDEITLIERLENLSTAEAVKRFLEMSGHYVALPPGNRSGRAPVVPLAPFDWIGCAASFNQTAGEKLASWRGYSPALVEWLRSRSLLGMSRGQFALPVQKSGAVIGAHVRREDGKGWIYTPKGIGSQPLVIGDPSSARETVLAESQWDLFSFMDLMGVPPDERLCFIATRGAENGKWSGLCSSGSLVVVMQNDETKNGKNPAEKWLQDVISAAVVPVSVVRLPAGHKDLNDAQKAGFTRSDLLNCIAAAEEMPLPVRVITPEVLPPEAPGAAVVFDPMEVIEKLDLWWKGSKYYFRREGDDGFSELNQAEIGRFLRVDFGLSNKPLKLPDDPAGGTIPGQVDRVLNHVVKMRYVDAVASVAGVKAGFYQEGGARLLVVSTPKLIEPAPGECETILDFLQTLLGDDGSLRFRLWLKVGYEALRSNQRRHGQALVLCGPSGKGKSVLQSKIITAVLAGREADPKSYLSEKTDFNSEMIASEHLKIEEIPSSVRYDDRLTLGERIKELCVNHSQRLHEKNKVAVTVKPQWRLSISLNDEPERLRCLPPLTTDFRDKLLLLKTGKEDFFARYDGETDPLDCFISAVEKQLPSFCDHLLSLEVPESLKDRRYGVRSYVDVEIEELLFDQEPESLLLSLVDEVLFGSSALDFKDDGSGGFNPWEGSATELRDKLTDQNSKGYMSARKLLDGAAEQSGRLLGKLEKKFPERFHLKRTGKKRAWIIQPPSLNS
jgi:hypothetical protein